MVWRATTKSTQPHERMEISIFHDPVTESTPRAPLEGARVELDLIGKNQIYFDILRYDDFEIEIAFNGNDHWILRSISARTLEFPPELPVDALVTHWIVVQHVGH